MKLAIFGSTGMVGRAAIVAAQNDTRVSEIIAVVRRDELPAHPKLKILVHPNLRDLSPIASHFKELTGTIFAIGVTSSGMSEQDYTAQTLDLTSAVAKQILEFSPQSKFVYISGSGADSTEKGPVMWARVRGKLENMLLAMSFSGVYVLRPAIIIPQDGIKSKTTLYRISYFLMTPILPLLQMLMPKHVTSTRKLGALMISLALLGREKKILESKDFNQQT